MASSNAFRMHCRALLLCMIGAALTGCGAQRPHEASAFQMIVQLDGQPTGNIRVRLVPAEDRRATPCYEGITTATGIAAMKPIEGGAQGTTYVVVCESLGDWQIRKPWSSVEESPLTATWNGEETLTIELPAKAARPL